MNGGGPGSGIWKSTDGGETWTRLKGGVLDGPLGRIGIDVYRKRPNILYALIEGPAGRAVGAAEAMAPAQRRRARPPRRHRKPRVSVVAPVAARRTRHRPACIGPTMAGRRGGR